MTITATRYATVNGVPLDTYGWRVVRGGYDELLNTPAVRGADLVVPLAHGARAYPRWIDVTLVSIGMVINGRKNEAGTLYADPITGMLTNRDYLEANLGIADDAASATRGTVPFTLVRPALSTLTADVTVLGLRGWSTRGGGLALVRLDLSFPERLS